MKKYAMSGTIGAQQFSYRSRAVCDKRGAWRKKSQNLLPH